jgi:hypothetical protein
MYAAWACLVRRSRDSYSLRGNSPSSANLANEDQREGGLGLSSMSVSLTRSHVLIAFTIAQASTSSANPESRKVIVPRKY